MHLCLLFKVHVAESPSRYVMKMNVLCNIFLHVFFYDRIFVYMTGIKFMKFNHYCVKDLCFEFTLIVNDYSSALFMELS